MVFDSRTAAVRSLNEFDPWLRQAHKIVRFWSSTHNRYRFTRVLR